MKENIQSSMIMFDRIFEKNFDEVNQMNTNFTSIKLFNYLINLMSNILNEIYM